MSDYEFRRLDLKSQMLSIEISQLDHCGRELSRDLRKREQVTSAAEQSWSKFLKESVISYRNSAPQLQAQILDANLRALADTKKILHKKKQEELQLRARLSQIQLKSRTKNTQLVHCQSQKKSRKELRELRIEQNSTDEFSAIKSVNSRNQSSASLYKTRILNIDEKPSESVEQSEVKDVAERDFNSDQLPDNPLQPVEICIQSGTQSAETLPTLSSRTDSESSNRYDHTPDSTSTDSGQAEQKWEQAKKSQEIISEQNNQVKIAVLHTEQGDAVCIDYLLSPGRMLSVAGSTSSESAAVAINLSASSAIDRASLAAHRGDLLDLLRKSGLTVSNLEVSGK